MIARSDVIAIVDVRGVKDVWKRGKGHTYAKEAAADVKEVLKGTLSQEVKIYGSSGVRCNHYDLAKGRFLVFLGYDGLLLIGVNGHLSIRPIEDEQVDWFVNPNTLLTQKQPLKRVIDDLKRLLR